MTTFVTAAPAGRVSVPSGEVRVPAHRRRGRAFVPLHGGVDAAVAPALRDSGRLPTADR
jgi:hypothetical protein